MNIPKEPETEFAQSPPVLRELVTAELAKFIRAATLRHAGMARAETPETHLLDAEQCDWNTRLILSVAEKFLEQGGDYLPAIREFRAALNEPRSQKITFSAEGRLDTWLAQLEKAPKKP